VTFNAGVMEGPLSIKYSTGEKVRELFSILVRCKKVKKRGVLNIFTRMAVGMMGVFLMIYLMGMVLLPTPMGCSFRGFGKMEWNMGRGLRYKAI